MQDQTQCSDPASSVAIPSGSSSDQAVTETEELPLDFHAEMSVHAVDPITGTKVELGYDHDGEWISVWFGEGPSLLNDRRQLESWLTDPDTLEACDGPMDLEFSRQCVRETIQRCLSRAKEVLAGQRPLPDRVIEVWPVNSQVWRVEQGDRIPPGVTHVREVDPLGISTWTEIPQALRQ